MQTVADTFAEAAAVDCSADRIWGAVVKWSHGIIGMGQFGCACLDGGACLIVVRVGMSHGYAYPGSDCPNKLACPRKLRCKTDNPDQAVCRLLKPCEFPHIRIPELCRILRALVFF